MNLNNELQHIQAYLDYKVKMRHTGLLLLSGSLRNLVLVQVVLLGKLHVLQELGITSLHAHMSLDRGFPETITVILPALVVGGMVLTLGHSVSRLFSCRSESSNISL